MHGVETYTPSEGIEPEDTGAEPTADTTAEEIALAQPPDLTGEPGPDEDTVDLTETLAAIKNASGVDKGAETPEDTGTAPEAPADTSESTAAGGSGQQPPRDGPPPGGAEAGDDDNPEEENDRSGETADTAADANELRHNQYGNVIVQNRASGPESMRVQLSNVVYQQEGLGAFTSQRIPLGTYTNREMAGDLASTIADRVAALDAPAEPAAPTEPSDEAEPTAQASDENAEKPNTEPVHLYELGSGHGLLSRNVLDDLKANHPAVYGRTTVHVTDFSQASVEKLRESGIYDEHAGHVVFEQMDATQPSFPEEAKPTAVFHTYLGDSLPTHHMIVRNGEVHERLLQTTIDDGAQLIDATGEEPRVLDTREIVDIMQNGPDERRAQLAPKLVGLMDLTGEYWQEVPLSETDFTEEEKAQLEELGRTVPNDQQFNYSKGLQQSVQHTVDGLKEGGIVFVGDFGLKGTLSANYDPRTHFGAVTSSSLSFFTIEETAQNMGVGLTTSNNPDGGPREMLFDTSPDPQTRAEASADFARRFDDRRQEVSQFLNAAGALLDEARSPTTSPEVAEARLAEIDRLYDEQLSEPHKTDLELLTALGDYLITAGHRLQAKRYVEAAIREAPHVVVPAYRQAARIHLAEGDLYAAEESLQQAHTIAPQDRRTAELRLETYKRLGNTEAYREAAANYVRLAPRDEEIRSLRRVADDWYFLGEWDEEARVLEQVRVLQQTATW